MSALCTKAKKSRKVGKEPALDVNSDPEVCLPAGLTAETVPVAFV